MTDNNELRRCEVQDTFYVGTLKGVGADLLNGRVLSFFEPHEVPLLRILTDRYTEFCGEPERHEYELYLAFSNHLLQERTTSARSSTH